MRRFGNLHCQNWKTDQTGTAGQSLIKETKTEFLRRQTEYSMSFSIRSKTRQTQIQHFQSAKTSTDQWPH